MPALVRHLDYKPFFELIEEPFNTVASPRFFYLSPIHAIALNKSVSAVTNRKGVSVVFGDVGTGKSTLARIMHEHFLQQGFISVLLTNPGYVSENALMRTINEAFDIKPGRSLKENEDRLKAFLLEKGEIDNKTIVLIIDEAQELKLPLLEAIRRILNYESDKKLLQLVLFPQEEFRTKLQDYRTRNFRRRIVDASTLDRMDVDTVGKMIDFRWRVASGNKQHPFTRSAISRIYDYSNGLPSEACVVADNACYIAAINEYEQITDEVVEAAIRDRSKNVGSLDNKPVQKPVPSAPAQNGGGEHRRQRPV
jgi:general secretion pathway protein A